MLLIVGLGNPGPQYALNRHNVGFMALDAIHRRHGFPPWRRRFQGEVSERALGGDKVLLLKPQTYMNESGRAVGEAARFYKIEPEDIVVIHDEVDLPPGKTRIKTGGGAAGHNGLRSIDGVMGPDYRRVRIGVGHPGVKEAVPHYVLHDFAKADAAWLEPLIDAIAANAPLLAEKKDATFANRIHAALQPAKEDRAGDKAPATPDKPAPGGRAKDGAVPPKAGTEAPQAGEGPLSAKLKKLFGL